MGRKGKIPPATWHQTNLLSRLAPQFILFSKVWRRGRAAAFNCVDAPIIEDDGFS